MLSAFRQFHPMGGARDGLLTSLRSFLTKDSRTRSLGLLGTGITGGAALGLVQGRQGTHPSPVRALPRLDAEELVAPEGRRNPSAD